jgi:hypothetical protein
MIFMECIHGHDLLLRGDGSGRNRRFHQVFAIPSGKGGWNPITESRYLTFFPSVNLVDILGYDFYSTGPLTSTPNTWEGRVIPELTMIVGLARAHNKVAAMTEGRWAMGYQQ